jgi:iron complex outermembrane receptor protein
MIALYQYTAAQNKISGIITDQNNIPLASASVFVPDLNKGTVSDKNGYYELQNLPNGKLNNHLLRRWILKKK